MRLKQIKLAGFKSFVDPTTVPFPAQMTAIVGPNGCGKSNIIDAVRWVLGESSAKNLRGDAMTDVIFNGSSARKPVSQASIELVFDNSSGRLEGEYANYNEISVKRSVNRDPTSQYLLNGSKCRKKDITDLFLGTGLGPRSYSIIEQGMISRLIESKPQELRLFIEEAAGISKYKERRRETENRIRHTRENLERLEDVISELQQQLEKLQRQAAAAKRFKDLKQKERQFKSELNVLKWQRLNGQAEALDSQIKQLELELEQLVASQRGDESKLNQLKIEQFQARQKLEEMTQSLFRHTQEVSRAEQNLVHYKAQKAQLIEQQNKYSVSQTQLIQELSQAEQNLMQSRAELEETEPDLEICHETLAQIEHNIDAAEQAYQQANQQWSEQSKGFYQLETQLKSMQASYQALQQRLSGEKQRLDVSQNRLAELTQQQQSGTLEQISEEKSIAQTRVEAIQEQIAQAEDQLQVDLSARNAKQRERQALVGHIQTLEAEITSLNVLIKKQTIDHQQGTEDWLKQHHLNEGLNLYQAIEVEAGWEQAVDTVLKQWQKAYLVKQRLPIETDALPAQNIYLISSDNEQAQVELNALQGNIKKSQHASLASKVKAPLSIKHILSTIAVAETQTQMQVLYDKIQKTDEPAHLGFNSVINAQGVWQGLGWQIFSAPEQDNIFALKQELAQCEQSLSDKQSVLAELTHALERCEQASERTQTELKNNRQSLQSAQQQNYQLDSQYQSEKAKLDYQAEQKQQLEQDIENIEQSIELAIAQSLDLEMQIETLQTELAEYEDNHQNSQQALQASQQNLKDLQQQRESQLQTQYQTKLKVEQIGHQIQTHQTKLESTRDKLEQIEVEQEETAGRLLELEEPMQSEAEKVQLLIEQKAEDEAQKSLIADELAEVEFILSDIEKGQHGLFSKQQALKDEINRLQLDQEGYRVRARSVLEVLGDLNTNLRQVLETLDPDAEEDEWQKQLDKTTQAISRLGAINLAAIEEYEHQSERKQYLDAQHQDLISALDTLEDAIRKIDRETKAKFRDTFEAVNQDLQQLFPKVFGGGAAWLELTDDDLLETGVTIMARPPGKRNSTIHLLSGGEKALTALSLVFAIFRLNPAPFCMLDEVDAPLDDANVGRFCRLVQEMSESVQFIFISHNKIAMEMATHLVGVTMQEPGVSRMVAVDIDKAIELAEL